MDVDGWMTTEMVGLVEKERRRERGEKQEEGREGEGGGRVKRPRSKATAKERV